MIRDINIAADAAIAATKIAAGTLPAQLTLASAKIVVGNASGVGAAVDMSGDTTISNAGVVAIGATKVTNAMLAGAVDPAKVTVADTKIIVGNGSNVGAAVTMSSDATLANTGALTIANTAVSNAKLASNAVTNVKITDDTIKQTKFDRRFTLEEFKCNPLTAQSDGTVTSGATGEVNIMNLGENQFEYAIKGAGQTITTPPLTAVGLNVALDLTADEGIEVTQGILSKSKQAFVAGTDACYAKLQFKITDVSGTDDCAFGFRKAEAYQANVDDYDEMAALNVISGDIKIETILNNGATTTTDTTDNWADLATHTLEVYVAANRAVTYKIDGVDPTATAAFSFDNAEVIVPFFFFLHDAVAPGAVELISWEVGLQ